MRASINLLLLFLGQDSLALDEDVVTWLGHFDGDDDQVEDHLHYSSLIATDHKTLIIRAYLVLG